jgi:uncharacterized protein YndB with AHSA1/START domain/DNA-binding transcriptional ArsR family regulator
MSDDLIFKALADPHRRTLLDLLARRDGRSLADLQAHLPMTRFGVMKHLHVLEAAGLVSTRKAGREKLHFLNPVPIQLTYDRWVRTFARPWTEIMTQLKATLEDPAMIDPTQHVFVIFIRTTPERLWQALTDGTLTAQYYFGSAVASTWQPGAPYHYPNPAGGLFLTGEVLEADPPRRLAMTFQPQWFADSAAPRPSLVTWEIELDGGICKLTLTHSGLDPNHPGTAGILEGWARITSGLKTVLETGDPLFESSQGGAA